MFPPCEGQGGGAGRGRGGAPLSLLSQVSADRRRRRAVFESATRSPRIPFADPFHTGGGFLCRSRGTSAGCQSDETRRTRLGIYERANLARRESNAGLWLKAAVGRKRKWERERERERYRRCGKDYRCRRAAESSVAHAAMSSRVSEIYENIIQPGNSLKVSE